MPAIVVTGERLTDGALLPRLLELAREQGDDFPLDAFAATLSEITKRLAGSGERSYTVRLIQSDGSVEKVLMPITPATPTVE